MKRKKDNRVDPIKGAPTRAESAAESEDQVSISTISLEVEENSRRRKNKVEPLNNIKSVDAVEDQLGTPSIFNEPVEEGRINLNDLGLIHKYLQFVYCSLL